MSVSIYNKEEQAFGSFNGGKIKENKPIGFPQDKGLVKSYSNLFYWANAWSDKGGLIDEHPHKWFEILSFVIEGEIEHYDNKYKRWITLHKGDVQIIRAGDGITHAEKILPNSRMFQIWFDPNIAKTQHQRATYDDYKNEQFIGKQVHGIKTTNYSGNGGILKMDAEGVVIDKIELNAGNHTMELKENYFTSIYVLKSGNLTFNNNKILPDDFIIIENENQLLIQSDSNAELFVIKTPVKLSYLTYYEMAKF